MPKKIIVFSFLLLVLIGVSLWLLIKNQPQDSEIRPLQAIEQTKVGKIIIEDSTHSVTVEKKDQRWRLTAPLEDEADPEVIDQLVGTVTSFTIGSVLSEIKEKYPTFDLDPAKATHLRVYELGAEKPALDAFIGKQAISYGTSYFRFAAKVPVYIATNLPNWVLLKPADEYRLKRIFPAKQEEISKLEFIAEKMSESFSKSSTTWTRDSTKVVVDNSTISTLLGKLDAWRSIQFEDHPDPSLNLGFDKPYLVVIAVTSTGPKKSVIGAKKKVKKGEPDPHQRFTQTEGRKAVMLLGESSVEDVLTELKKLPKPSK